MSSRIYEEQLRRYANWVNGPYTAFLKRFGLDIEFVRAEGSVVFDHAGFPFIDCIAGYGNLNIGHNHPAVVEALIEELRSGKPFNWPFVSPNQAALAERLAAVTPGALECSFVVNSGSEAVESALKLVRLASGKPQIIATRGSWHGFTLGALSISEPAMCRDFQPLLSDVLHAPYGDVGAIERAVTEHTAAVIVEPVQAESGAVVPPLGYLADLAKLCRQRQIILILDEVKTGIGKTGRLFACEYEETAPDVLLLGKSLGGGAMPIGSITARRELWTKFGLSFPMSSSSSAGNRLACAAALATLEIVESENLCRQSARKGAALAKSLEALVARFPELLRGVSGRGLLLSLHTASPKIAAALIRQCVRRGVLVMTAFLDRTRILIEPPLSIPDTLLEQVTAVLRDALECIAEEIQPSAAAEAATVEQSL